MDAPGESNVTCSRVGCKAMLVTSWAHVLEGLLDAARAGEHDSIGHDILQLQGLTSRIDAEAFLPIRADEITDQEAARRLVNYSGLIKDITQRLKDSGVADTRRLRTAHGYYTAGRYLRVHGRFGLWLGIELEVWCDAGITPLWSMLGNDKFSGVAGHHQTIRELFDDVQPYESAGVSYIPIHLRAGGRVGAHNDALKLSRGLPQPFAPRLRNQRDGRCREKNPLSILGDLLGDAKCCEGLARAASHDESAPVVVGKSGDGVLNRLRLKRPRLLHGALGVLLFELDVEILLEVDLRDLGMGVLDRPFRVRPPSASRHDPPQAKDRLLGAAEKLVDLPLAQGMPIFVALALDGDPLTRGPPRYEIDSDVSTVEAGQSLALRPVGPAPDFANLELGLLKRDPHEQLFEPAPLL